MTIAERRIIQRHDSLRGTRGRLDDRNLAKYREPVIYVVPVLPPPYESVGIVFVPNRRIRRELEDDNLHFKAGNAVAEVDFCCFGSRHAP